MLNLFRRKKNTQDADNAVKQYYLLRVKNIIQETPDAISIVFEMPKEGMNYQAGQFLTLIAKIDGKEVRRSYSFCSTLGIDKDLAVTVKKVRGGLMSNYLADQIKVGDEIRVMEPLGNFTTEVKKENKRQLVFFAGGSGITPFMSLLKFIMNEEPQSTISLVYANRNINSIIFKDQLDQLAIKYQSRLNLNYILDEAPDDWSGFSGFLDATKLDTILAGGTESESREYWMCGPQGMMQIVESYLAGKAISQDRIRKESFVAASHETNQSENGLITRNVTIIYEGQEQQITVKPDSTILETGLDAGIDLPYSCQSGLCTACRCSLLSGEIKMDEDEGLTEKEKEDGYVLICVGHPLTDDVKLKVG
ncbi:MAG: 2Fe-2S iron-sulfur cluster-binding protein [Cyclobacteriaceae bacterium]